MVPTTQMNSVVKVPLGQSTIIHIPMFDADGDMMRCRWANIDEGGVHYRRDPIGNLSSNPCELKYTAGNREGYVAVTIIIEDFDENNVSMSYISVQFLIEIINNTLSSTCNIIPLYLGDRIQGECVSVNFNKEVRERVVLQVGCSGISIVNISADTNILNLMIEPAVRDPSNSHIFIAYIKWTPSTILAYNLCLTVQDSLNQSSTPACWKYQINSTEDRIFEFIKDSQIPSSKQQVRSFQYVWQIKMSKSITEPPSLSSDIRFYQVDSGAMSEEIHVTWPLAYLKYTDDQLTFHSTTRWKQNTTYGIVFDTGVAINRDICGTPSPFQPYSDFWLFSIYPSCASVCPNVQCNSSVCQCPSMSSTIVYCERIPVVYSISPLTLYNTANTTLVTFFGDNLDVASEVDVWECIVFEYTSIILISKTKIQCITERIFTGLFTVTVQLSLNKHILGQQNLEVVEVCPPEGCIHGTCILGICRCQAPYRGTNCSSLSLVPVLRMIENQTAVEGSSFELNITSILEQGDQPLIWSFDAPNTDIQLQVNNQSNDLSFYWSNTIARLDPYKITVFVQQVDTQTTVQQTFYLTVSPCYSVSVSYGQNLSGTNVIQSISSIPIQGTVSLLDSRYQISINRTSILVWIELNGYYRQYLPSVLIEQNGQFKTRFIPLNSEYGTLTLGASHPLFRNQDTYQDRLTLLGFRIEVVASMPLQLRVNTVARFNSIALLNNPTNVSFNFIQIILIEPKIANIDFNVSIVNCSALHDINKIAQLPRNSSCALDLSIHVNRSYQGSFGFRFLTDVGVSKDLYLSVHVKPDRPEYTIQPNDFNIVVARGAPIQYFSTTLFNIGSQRSSLLDIRLPNQTYVHVLTPSISNVAVDGNATITFGVRAYVDSPLQSYDIICAVVDIQAQLSLNILMHLTIVGSNSTQVHVIFVIEDEFTYFADTHPYVSNVTLTLFNPQLNIRLQMISGSNESGRIEALVTPAVYQLNVQALKHKPLSTLITIDVTNHNKEWRIFLQRQLVSYTWSVTPTEIEQEYTFNLEAKFETNVPAPVVTMEPSTLMLSDMESGLIDHVDLVLTNHGLIRADNIQIYLPNTHPFLKFRIVQEPIGNISANTSILVTLSIERSQQQQQWLLSKSIDSNCLSAFTSYEYVCAGTQLTIIPVPVFQNSDSSSVSSILDCNIRTLPIGNGFNFNFEDSNVGIGGPTVSSAEAMLQIEPIIEPLCLPQIPPCGDKLLNCACSLRGVTIPSKLYQPFSSSALASQLFSSRAAIPTTVDCLINLIPGISCVYNAFKLVLELAGDILNNKYISEDSLWAASSTIFSCSNSAWAKFIYKLVKCTFTVTGSCFGQSKSFRLQAVNRRSVSAIDVAREDVSTMLGAMDNFVELAALIYGNVAWFDVDDPSWFEAFARASSNSSELGIYISNFEYQNLISAIPYNTSLNMTIDFLLHYNQSIIEWTSPITNENETSSSSLSKQQFIDRLYQLSIDFQNTLIKGYNNFGTALRAAYIDYLKVKDDAINQRGVCAQVKIRILQKVTIVRQAFEARLELDNSGDTPLEHIRLDILITDNENKMNSTHLFSIGQPSFDGSLTGGIQGNGSLLASQSGSVSWLIIPYATAAFNQTTIYWVGGRLSYLVDGQRIEIVLIPDSIEVGPEAQLHIAYFLEKDVIGPDPLSSSSVVQKSEPFTLAMIITNNGMGQAKDFRITSGQPEIIENEKGLLINIQIISMYVDHQTSSSPSLHATVGNIEPYMTVNIRWSMLSSLMGQFISFNATFSEKNPNGDPKLSLIASLITHTLFHLVSLDILDETLSDDLNDFLVIERANARSIPDTVISSTNATLALSVYHIQNVTITIIDDSTIILLATFDSLVPPTAYIYLRIDNMWPMRTIQSVWRSTQNITVNTWITRRVVHLAGGDQYDDYLHIFDRHNSQQSIEYKITFDTSTTTLTTLLSEKPQSTMSSMTSSPIRSFQTDSTSVFNNNTSTTDLPQSQSPNSSETTSTTFELGD